MIAPDVSNDIVHHVNQETERFGKEGMDPAGYTQSVQSSATPSNKMFGSKIMEQECRAFLEETFRVPFPTVRPDFLKRPTTKRNLEIDCYNDELKLGLEYMGPQHRVYLPLHHKFDIQNFYDQVERDEWKVQKCKELGIDLIVVPDTVQRTELRSFLHNELRRLGRL
jgi:hypothetical protein